MDEKFDVERYLLEIKKLIVNDKYKIARGSKRKDNDDLFIDYIIGIELVKEILLSLEIGDFVETLHNDHEKYKYELLYVFGKKVKLLERFGDKEKEIELYIKINKLKDCYVIVISFHEAKYPMKYKYKQ